MNPNLMLVKPGVKALWEGERICQMNANGSLAIPSSKNELCRIKVYLDKQNLGGNEVGLGGHIPNVTDRQVTSPAIVKLYPPLLRRGAVLSKGHAKKLWTDIVGVPQDGWDGDLNVVKNGKYQHCVFAYKNNYEIGINDVECGRQLNAFLCYENVSVKDCPNPQQPPDQDVQLLANEKTRYSLGDNVTYVCPFWKAWNPPSNPPSPFRTSQCFGSLGWEYKLEDLRSCIKGDFCPPILLPRKGDPYTKAINVSTPADPEGRYAPGSNVTLECGLKNFSFSSGNTLETWTCQNNGEWTPINISMACIPQPNTTCKLPGDEDAIAFTDHYLVGSMVYCIHNESLQLSLTCTENLTWYPEDFTPCKGVYPYFEVTNKSFLLGKPKNRSLDGNFGAAAFCHEQFNSSGLPELKNRTEMESVVQYVLKHVDDGYVPLPYNILQFWKEGKLPENGSYNSTIFWKFQNGDPISNDLFSPGHPNDPENGHCSVLDLNDGRFWSANCSQPFDWALCQLNANDSCQEFSTMTNYTWNWPRFTAYGKAMQVHCRCGQVWLDSIPKTKREDFQCYGNIGYDIRSMTKCVEAYSRGCGSTSSSNRDRQDAFLIDPGEFCPPIPLPRKGDPYTKAINVSTRTDPKGMYPPGSNLTYECGQTNFSFSSGKIRETWTCQVDGKWTPENVSVACCPHPNTTCKSPGNEDDIALPDHYLVGTVVYCIHNESIQLSLTCAENLTWYPEGFTPCEGGCGEFPAVTNYSWDRPLLTLYGQAAQVNCSYGQDLPDSVSKTRSKSFKCYGNIGYDIRSMTTCIKGDFCPPILLPRKGDPYTKAINVSTPADLEGRYAPGSNVTLECGLKNFSFSSGNTLETWTCQDNGEWTPINISMACIPQPNTNFKVRPLALFLNGTQSDFFLLTFAFVLGGNSYSAFHAGPSVLACKLPGDEDAIAFTDHYLVGSMVYCIHNESLQLSLTCNENLTWYPTNVTPCKEVYPYFEVGNGSFVLGKPKNGPLDGNFGAAAFCHDRFNSTGLPELRNRTDIGLVAQAIMKYVDDGCAPLPYNILQLWKDGELPKYGSYNATSFWKFRDGEPISNDLFSLGHPNDPENGHCSALDPFNDGGFRDVNCSQPLDWALCQLHVNDSCGEFRTMTKYASHWPLYTAYGEAVQVRCRCGQVWLGSEPETRKKSFTCYGNIEYDIRSMTTCIEACGKSETQPSLEHADCLDLLNGCILSYKCNTHYNNSIDGVSLHWPEHPKFQCIENQWRHNNITCILYECFDEPTPSVNHAVLHSWKQNSKLINATATYRCESGYTYSSIRDSNATKKSICKTTGYWSEVEDCVPSYCPSDPPPANESMKLVWDKKERLIGNNSTYDCFVGYRFSVNESKLQNRNYEKSKDGLDVIKIQSRCQANMTWEHVPLQCVPSICSGNPPNVTGAVLISTNGGVTFDWNGSFEVGTNVIYSCPDHMTFPEGRNVTKSCIISGQWETLNETCNWFECPGSPPPPPDGGFSNWNGHLSPVGYSVTYRCPDNHLFNGTALEVRKECLPNGSWQPLNEVCLEMECHSDPPDPPVGGARFWNGSSVAGNRPRYSCPRGMEFETSGETLTLSCLETGEWEPLEKCIWVECLEDPMLLSMHFISNWDGTSRKVGTTFQYMCLIAFQTTVVGRCEETGKWSSPSLLDCDRKFQSFEESLL
ncbi:unnamed protein product [Darwinula stevensoni]|uniref:Sushi domain-containing protein n=1 Tax=Darwinula stevensoni TaxID=69355 RepID=A0A7R8X416_9CRUS|nr:unnamed protein product [Darwinula stevensoni]CAG0883145.1 unnamed protein product [Darwinula stevensoni]